MNQSLKWFKFITLLGVVINILGMALPFIFMASGTSITSDCPAKARRWSGCARPACCSSSSPSSTPPAAATRTAIGLYWL
jgi:hypothetical protein